MTCPPRRGRHPALGRVLAGLALLTLAVVAAVFTLLPPVPQWLDYHQFADRRVWLGVPNFADVASNLPFTLLGLLGLYHLLLAPVRPQFHDPRERWPWLVFCVALVLLGPASAWYHLAPDNAGLFWDRLAMSVLFMAWLSIQFNDRLGAPVGLIAWPVLVALGMAAVGYWSWSEAQGRGDLRAYGIMHFYPIVVILLLFVLTPPRYTRAHDVLWVLALYGAALAAEALDHALFELGGVISGHTLKHLLAAFAVWWALRMLMRRRPLAGAPETEAPSRGR